MSNAFKMIFVAITGMMMAVIAQVNGVDFYPTEGCESSCCECPERSICFSAELLYWRPELCGLEGAFGDTAINTTVVGNVITTTVTESDEEPNFKWDPGFRLGVGTLWDCYDVRLDWTHFDGSADFHADTQFGKWKINYDVIDFTVGSRFCFGSCAYLIPYIGVRGALIKHTLISHLETIFTSIIGSNSVFTDIDEKERMWGVGPEIGLKGDWDIGCNFSLYGKINVVSYYGDANNKSFNSDTFTGTVSICNGRKSHCFNTIGTDAEIGIRWLKSICCSCYEVDFMLNLGLEQHRIYNFSELSEGTLSLDGGVFGACLAFRY